MMIIDRDTIFSPLVKHTLTNMGIQVRQIDYKCPWQNGVVERSNLTLQTELLALITAFNLTHMNRLLRQYREYYNSTRPHMTNDDFPPDKPDKKPVIVPFPDRKLSNVKSVSWVGGFITVIVGHPEPFPTTTASPYIEKTSYSDWCVHERHWFV